MAAAIIPTSAAAATTAATATATTTTAAAAAAAVWRRTNARKCGELILATATGVSCPLLAVLFVVLGRSSVTSTYTLISGVSWGDGHFLDTVASFISSWATPFSP